MATPVGPALRQSQHDAAGIGQPVSCCLLWVTAAQVLLTYWTRISEMEISRFAIAEFLASAAVAEDGADAFTSTLKP